MGFVVSENNIEYRLSYPLNRKHNTKSLKKKKKQSDRLMADKPATMALAVKNTKLIGTTSVASNIFIA